jgi:NAD(P)-dependent dehydrogenase (short-subunit alcohol dehydrogenase family)
MTEQKTVLITGASSGFGRLMVKSFGGAGYRVFAGFRDPNGRDAGVVATLASELGGALEPLTLDVTSDASVQGALASVAQKTKPLHALINNAGVSAMGVAEAFTEALTRALFEVNVLGAQRMNRAAIPLLSPKNGVIVHISTGLARMPMPCFGPYAASKAALEALAETYRYELSVLGIDSVIVEPGPYPTNLGASAFAADDPARASKYGPLADLPERMMQGLAAWFSGPAAPRAEEVPEAVLKLVETPTGQRPLRTVVGGGADALGELNALSDRLQAQLLSAQGLADLLKARTSA